MPESVIPSEVFLSAAARAFVESTSTASAEHIKPLHRYLGIRLVMESGFLPEDITPSPPLRYQLRNGRRYLAFAPDAADSRERVVLGGLKSKRIDLVVAKKDIGPVLAVSVKGTGRAFRNLVNRTEEAIGDCANIHMMFPGLVYGFIHFLKAADPSDRSLRPNDISLDSRGNVLPAIQAYAKILRRLAARKLVRNDHARYEATGLVLLSSKNSKRQSVVVESFPPEHDPLRLTSFLATLYEVYDQRFPYTYTDPALKHLARVEWHPDSPAISGLGRSKHPDLAIGYLPRTDASA